MGYLVPTHISLLIRIDAFLHADQPLPVIELLRRRFGHISYPWLLEV
jgi:hypothetical protein